MLMKMNGIKNTLASDEMFGETEGVIKRHILKKTTQDNGLRYPQTGYYLNNSNTFYSLPLFP